MMMWRTDEVQTLFMMALCAWRESRGESRDARRGVLHVIHNRASKPSWWGTGTIEVILKPYQFSCFNAGDPNATKIPGADDVAFKQILELAANVLVNQDEDLTDGATHYHDRNVFPEWAAKMKVTATIGAFTFYKETI